VHDKTERSQLDQFNLTFITFILFLAPLKNVLLVICTLMLFWFAVSHLKMQQALQWWHRNRSTWLHGEAEQIRNGLLQESFVVRRALEMSLIGDENLQDNQQHCLKKLEDFHHALEQVSDTLSPPYVEDNLPLAIRRCIESQCSYPIHFDIETDLPSTWRHEPYELSRTILIALDELLRVTQSKDLVGVLRQIRLRSQAEMRELMIQFGYLDRTTLKKYQCRKELDYLKQSVLSLALTKMTI
jgi:hypothetical protein